MSRVAESSTEGIPVSRRTRAVPALLAGGVLVLSLALGACGADPETDSETSALATSAPADSDSGGAASDGGGAEPAEEPTEEEPPEAVAVTPPEQEVELSNACTDEGVYLVKKGKSAKPALEKRDGATLKVGLTEVTEDDGANLTVTIDGEKRTIETAHVGDTVGLDDWTISITSVCEDQVEFDLID
jgi:hypothetical protein